MEKKTPKLTLIKGGKKEISRFRNLSIILLFCILTILLFMVTVEI